MAEHDGSRAAERIAARVRAAGGRQSMTLRELRDEFAIQRLTSAGRRRIVEELADAGMVVAPDLRHLFLDDGLEVRARSAAHAPAAPPPRSAPPVTPPSVAPPPVDAAPATPSSPAPEVRRPRSRTRRGALWGAGVAAVVLVLIVMAALGGGDAESPQPSAGATAVAAAATPDPRRADYAAARRMAGQGRYGAASLAMEDLDGYRDARRLATAYANRQAAEVVTRARRELASGDLQDARRLLRAAEGWAPLASIADLRGEIAAEQEAREAAARAAEQAAAEQAAAEQAAAEQAAAEAAAQAAAASSGDSGCDPNYSGACVPLVSYDLDCADIGGPVTVVGADPHGFDREGDGLGCESG